jgi:hypothetical protein
MRFQGLGRKENPTERAIVEVVHPDGTYDCRVPGRPHPYTRLQTCGGQRPLHVGQTVEVAFVDYQRTGRRWMPFILGASKSHLESGMSRGRVSRGLAWHNGADGTPDYTGSLYSLDTGYRKWRHDAGWSIPGPWDAIIGYTVDQGYILTVHGKDVHCYLAENGAPAWEYELPQAGGKPVYNPARREVVFWRRYGDSLCIDAILDAATGQSMADSHVLDAPGAGRPYLWGDKLFWIKYSGGRPYEQPPSLIWTRSGTAGYTSLRTIYLMQADISWGNGIWKSMGAVGPAEGISTAQFVYGKRFYYTYQYDNSNMIPDTPSDQYERRAWECLGVLDLETESSTITDNTFGTPGPIGGENVMIFLDLMVARSGHLHGILWGYIPYAVLSPVTRYVRYGSDGRRTFEGPIVRDKSDFYRGICNDDLVVVATSGSIVILKDGSPLWTLPAGDRFTGYGGESTRGEASWVLAYSPGGYHFRDFRTGAVLGPWAGSTPVMVSAGIIYDTDDDGNLCRWVG